MNEYNETCKIDIKCQGFAYLSTEILHEIFSNLNGFDVLMCYKVSQHWKAAVKLLSNNVWEKIFFKEYSDQEYYRKNYKESQVLWKDYYKARSVWKYVHATKVKQKLVKEYCLDFQMRSDGAIGILNKKNCNSVEEYHPPIPSTSSFPESKYRRRMVSELGFPIRDNSYPITYGDTISYYDLNTLEKLDDLKLSFMAANYRENDEYIAVTNTDTRLCMFPKSTMKRNFLGPVHIFSPYPVPYVPLEKELLFHHEPRSLLCTSKNVGEPPAVKTRGLNLIAGELIAATQRNNEMFVLVMQDKTRVFRFVDYKLENVVAKFDLLYQEGTHLVQELEKYGFDWTTPIVLHKIVLSSKRGSLWRYQLSSVCKHGPTILLGTYDRKIHIFAEAYRNGRINTFDATPDKTIDMAISEPLQLRPYIEGIQQMHVLEKRKGHKIVVLTGDRIYVVELTYRRSRKYWIKPNQGV